MPDLDLLCLLLSSVDKKQILLLRYYELEIKFLRQRLKKRLLPDEAEKAAFARLAVEIGRPELAGRTHLFHPETLFRWHREQVAQKFDGSAQRGPGRPCAWQALYGLIQRLAGENPTWGAPRLHGQLMALGFSTSEESIRRIMRRLGLDPNQHPEGRWSQFLERHQATILATDFFSYEARTPSGLKTLYGLFFIQHDSRRIHLSGISEHPDEAWMLQAARNLSMETNFIRGKKILIMDRDTKYCARFREILADHGIRCLQLPPRSPNLNAFAERWIRSLKEECLQALLLPDAASLQNALKEYLEHFHHERAHQGLGNVIPFPLTTVKPVPLDLSKLQRKSRLGGLLNYYYWPSDSQENCAPCNYGDIRVSSIEIIFLNFDQL